MFTRLFNSLVKRTKVVRSLEEDVAFLKNFLTPEDYIQPLSGGAKLHLPVLFDDLIQKRIAQTADFFEINLLKKLDAYLTDDSVILDIGANIGNHSVYWGYGHPRRRIFAFEPIAATFAVLQRNIAENKLQAIVQTYNQGISNAPGQACIAHYNPKNSGGTQLKQSESGNISLITVDGLALTSKIDFIKIDTEGFEMEVLQGAAETLRRDKPTVFIEIFERNERKAQLFFTGIGYRLAKSFGENNYLYLPTGTRQADQPPSRS